MLGSFFQVIFHVPDCKQNFLKHIIKLKTSVPRGNVHDEKHWEKPATDVPNGHQQTLTALLWRHRCGHVRLGFITGHLPTPSSNDPVPSSNTWHHWFIFCALSLAPHWYLSFQFCQEKLKKKSPQQSSNPRVDSFSFFLDSSWFPKYWRRHRHYTFSKFPSLCFYPTVREG